MNLITVQEEKNLCIFYIHIPDYGFEITLNLVIFHFFFAGIVMFQIKIS